MKYLIRILTGCIIVSTFASWGFFAHIQINRFAVFCLPAGISRFYKANIQYLSDHAVDPDKRRYADTAEAPRHYLDVELYEKNIDSIPAKWDDALKKYGLVRLNKNGILPWQIQLSYHKLVNAFKTRDSSKILIYSAYLGHYLGDAHVPLHTTQNHNGQLTNQLGIHAFWESRLPELFAKDYNYLIGRARYISNPLAESWKIIRHTHSLVDSVLSCEARISTSFPSYKKYDFSKRKHLVVKQYSASYSKAYHQAMNGMVARQMCAAMLAIGSFWYSAWVDAGQPILENMVVLPPDMADEQAAGETDKMFKKGKIIGRDN